MWSLERGRNTKTNTLDVRVKKECPPKCDKCGRFFSMKDWMNGKIGSYFEPDSDRGREILEFWHLYDCKRRSKI